MPDSVCLKMDSRLLKLFVIIATTCCTVGTDKPPLECPPGAVVTTLDGGRFGNLAWEYASVWALAKYLPCNRTPYSTDRINNFLVDIFEHLSLPAIQDLRPDCKCFTYNDVYTYNYPQPNFFDMKYAKTVTNCTENVILSRYPLLIQHVWEHAAELRQELQYKKHFIDSAYETMESCKAKFMADKTGDIQTTYVGLHVRRTDYPAFLDHFHKPTLPIEFYFMCLDYFRRRTDLGRSIFLVVSDEPEWVAKNLIANNEHGDVFLASRGDIDHPGYDITLLSKCNHSIIDYGSYGYWAAMYAGGETLVSNISYSYAVEALQDYPNWHFVFRHDDGSLHIK